MGKISTKELLDGYFESIKDTGANIKKLRAMIDKPELYDYEKEIGKELIDMDVDDLFGLVKRLYNNTKDGKKISFMTSHNSYDSFASLLRAIFNYYIDTVQPIKNPLYDKRMKGVEAARRLSEGTEAFTKEMVDDIISKLHADYEVDKADYVEMIMLMYYCGFETAAEIVDLKEEMIDHRERTVDLPGRTIQLSNRLHKLLVKFDKMNEIQGWRTDSLVPYNGGYFKFLVKPSKVDTFDERPKAFVCDMINRVIATHVNYKYNTKINYSSLYWLGFYDYLVKTYGQEETDNLIDSYKDFEAATKILGAAKDYGLQTKFNVTRIKTYLRPFMKTR